MSELELLRLRAKAKAKAARERAAMEAQAAAVPSAPSEASSVGSVQTMEQMNLGGLSQEEQIKRAQIAAQRQDNPGMTALFPRRSAQVAQGTEGDGTLMGEVSKAGAATGDVLSMAGRFFDSISQFKGETWDERKDNFLKSMAQTEGEGFISSFNRDPTTGAALALAPIIGPMAASGRMGAAGAGAIEGSGMALVNQLSNIGEGKEMSPGEALADLSLSMMMPTFGPMFKKAADPAKKLILDGMEKVVNPSYKRFASQLTGATTEALEIASTKKGREKLIRSADTFNDIGQELLDKIDNIDDHYPFEAQLKISLDNMPDIDVSNVRNSLNLSLEKTKSGMMTKPKLAAAKEIEDQIKFLDEYVPERGKISANDFRKMRKDLDVNVNFDQPGSDLANDAFKQARTAAMNDLVKAGKGTPYAGVMDRYAKTIQAKEKFYKDLSLGKTTEQARTKIESTLSNIFNRGKTERLKTFQNLDNMFGTDFVEKTKLASLAKSIVKDGGIPLFPMHYTGRSGLGPKTAMLMDKLPANIGSFPAAIIAGSSSPRIAAQTLGGMRQAGQGLAQAPGLTSSLMNNPVLQRTIPGLAREPFRQGLAGGQ